MGGECRGSDGRSGCWRAAHGVGVELEDRHGVDQFAGLGVQGAGSSRHFFHQRCVLLRGLVHLRDGFSHLAHPCALFAAGGADLSHDVRHSADGGHHFGHGGPCLVHEGRALFHALYAGGDEGFDFLGGFCAAPCQAAHFAGHHRKAPALFSGPGGFHGGVQGQDVGLKGDAVDHADDVGDLSAAVVDAFHGLDHFGHHLAALHGHGAGAHRQLVGGPGVVGVLAHGGTQLFHRGCRFFQRTGLLLRAGRQVVVARGNL
ncbi:hypothetical protein D3C71_1174200 [compost metagenome]